MRLLIIGGTGMLGHKLVQQLSNSFEVFATIRGKQEDLGREEIFGKSRIIENVDVEQFETVSKSIENVRPDYVLNCVGIIKQLPSVKNAIKTISINALLPHRLAEAAESIGAKLITISTDCVFDGTAGMYKESDFPNAKDLYGKSKHLGEVVDGDHLTLRTSIIGRELGTAHSLIEWLISNEGKTVKGFANAIYSGFPTIIMAEIIKDLIVDHPELKGLYHVSSEPISKYELLKLAVRHFGLKIDIEKDEEFKIDRSLDSTRFRNAAGFTPESWDNMIRKMADDNTPYIN